MKNLFLQSYLTRLRGLMLTLIILCSFGIGNMWGAVTPISLPYTYPSTYGKGDYTEARGCQYSLGNNYSSDPRLCFSSTGHHLTISLKEAPLYVMYNIKGNSFSGGTFKVQESSDGSSYTDVATYTTLGSTSTQYKSLNSTTRYIKFVYTTKSSGNVALGSISIGAACSSIDASGGVISLPAGSSNSYSGGDWGDNGAPTTYLTGVYNINGYCVSLTNAADYSSNSNGLQVKASNAGVISISNITSNYGVDVDVWIGSGNNFTLALSGTTSLTGQTAGTRRISTESTDATLTITNASGNAGYIKTITITPKEQVTKCATPTFSVSAGTYNTDKSVTISCETDGATIYYTTDGTTPSSSNGSTYSSAISITSTTTLKAIAVKAGLDDSDVATATYTIKCATPTFSVSAETYNTDKSVTLSTSYGTKIYYTTDGSTPTTSSTEYSSAITVSATTTIKAIAWKSGCSNSDVATATYTIKCATPTFSVSAGTYNVGQSVELATSYGTKIYYTTDGSTPTTSSTEYSSAITVSATTTIKAIAWKSGCSNSDVATATYTLKCVAPTFSPSGGTKSGAQSVTISTTTAGATIYYTTDGSTPTTSSTKYNGEITVSTTQTIKAIATLEGWTNSNVATATYTISYSVTWVVNGETWDSGVSASNNKANWNTKISTMPNEPDPDDYCGDKFMGWTKTNIGSVGLDKTEDADDITALNLFTDVSGSPAITEATTFYAVFADYAEDGE